MKMIKGSEKINQYDNILIFTGRIENINTVIKNCGLDNYVCVPSKKLYFKDFNNDFLYNCNVNNKKIFYTNSLEYIDVILNSDIENIQFITCVNVVNGVVCRVLDKEKAKQVRYEYDLELR